SSRSRKRPARTPPSTFLFLPIHLSNSPETMDDLRSGKPGEPSKPNHPTTVGGLITEISEELRGRNLTPRARRRAEIGYIGRPHLPCQHLRQRKSPAVETAGLAGVCRTWIGHDGRELPSRIWVPHRRPPGVPARPRRGRRVRHCDAIDALLAEP